MTGFASWVTPYSSHLAGYNVRTSFQAAKLRVCRCPRESTLVGAVTLICRAFQLFLIGFASLQETAGEGRRSDEIEVDVHHIQTQKGAQELDSRRDGGAFF